MALTKRQREVYEVVRDFIARHGYSPSLEEIGGALGLSSVATVHKHVSHLVDKGLLRRVWNQNRSIDLVEGGERRAAVPLPLLGTIAAGQPMEAVTTAETIGIPEDMVHGRGDSYVLRVRGDSMIEEGIRDGDYVVVEGRNTAREGETVVALLDGQETTLKKLYREGDEIRLQPANPSMSPILVASERLQVQGVVVGVIRKFTP